MTTSSRSPTKLSHAIHKEPSGAAAMEGQSSWRNSCPTAVELICPQRDVEAIRKAAARIRDAIIGTIIFQRSRIPMSRKEKLPGFGLSLLIQRRLDLSTLRLH